MRLDRGSNAMAGRRLIRSSRLRAPLRDRLYRKRRLFGQKKKAGGGEHASDEDDEEEEDDEGESGEGGGGDEYYDDEHGQSGVRLCRWLCYELVCFAAVAALGVVVGAPRVQTTRVEGSSREADRHVTAPGRPRSKWRRPCGARLGKWDGRARPPRRSAAQA